MTTAPKDSDCNQTVNAVGIRSTVGLGRIFNGQKYLKKDIDNQDGNHDDARVRQAPVRRTTINK